MGRGDGGDDERGLLLTGVLDVPVIPYLDQKRRVREFLEGEMSRTFVRFNWESANTFVDGRFMAAFVAYRNTEGFPKVCYLEAFATAEDLARALVACLGKPIYSYKAFDLAVTPPKSPLLLDLNITLVPVAPAKTVQPRSGLTNSAWLKASGAIGAQVAKRNGLTFTSSPLGAHQKLARYLVLQAVPPTDLALAHLRTFFPSMSEVITYILLNFSSNVSFLGAYDLALPLASSQILFEGNIRIIAPSGSALPDAGVLASHDFKL